MADGKKGSKPKATAKKPTKPAKPKNTKPKKSSSSLDPFMSTKDYENYLKSFWK
jgi:hypothetical protein